MLCTAELVSSPTLPVNSASFSEYSLKAVSSGAGAPAPSSGFCFLRWLRLAVFPGFPSASSSCSRFSSGCGKTRFSNNRPGQPCTALDTQQASGEAQPTVQASSRTLPGQKETPVGMAVV